MKNLYIIRGLPGSGKSTFASTLAKSLNAVHFEEDMYLTERDGTYLWSEERFTRAICVCHNQTHKACEWVILISLSVMYLKMLDNLKYIKTSLMNLVIV